MNDLFKKHPCFVVIMSGFSLGFIMGVAMGIAKHCV